MGVRQRLWAKNTRLKLRRLLGLKCIKCGSKDYRKLEFDCIVPLGDNHGKKEWSWRMSIYRRELKLNNLQLLCDKCHGIKSSQETKDRNNQPF